MDNNSTYQKESCKLAVFGDSYADSNIHHATAKGWAHYLCEINGWDMNTETLQTGLSGAGNWWAYSQFRKALNAYNIEHAVFVFTEPNRLPIAKISDDITPSAAFMSSLYDKILDADLEPQFGPGASYNEFQVIEMWREVFTDESNEYDLLHWINLTCAKECIQLAMQHNIKFTVMVPFCASMVTGNYDNVVDPDAHLIITCVDDVSLAEMQLHDPAVDDIYWQGHLLGAPFDTRVNHLNNHNNKILASLVNQGLQGHKGYIDFSQRDDLDTSPEAIQQYGKILFK